MAKCATTCAREYVLALNILSASASKTIDGNIMISSKTAKPFWMSMGAILLLSSTVVGRRRRQCISDGWEPVHYMKKQKQKWCSQIVHWRLVMRCFAQAHGPGALLDLHEFAQNVQVCFLLPICSGNDRAGARRAFMHAHGFRVAQLRMGNKVDAYIWRRSNMKIVDRILVNFCVVFGRRIQIWYGFFFLQIQRSLCNLLGNEQFA